MFVGMIRGFVLVEEERIFKNKVTEWTQTKRNNDVVPNLDILEQILSRIYPDEVLVGELLAAID